jgi:hypothetical protein
VILAETYLQLLGNFPHWAFELTVEAVSAAVGAVFARFWVKRHDRKHHAPPADYAFRSEVDLLQRILQNALLEQAQEIRLLKRRLGDR